MSQREVDYQRALLVEVARVFPDCRFFRRNVGFMKFDDGRVFKAAIPGQCDLYVLKRGGWHAEVEIKRFGKLSDAQEAWRKWCSEWGIAWCVLEARKQETPAQTVARWVEELRPWLKSAGTW